ncbi:hypothetical protein PT974_05537 [Cladobotryum mycophilum]|uniref:Ionotropic glutamate receptor C-terminal domain-containing protein n=1 Tax=Cladobotryum mycophilum TaxID=491253 RepID=A0ABR0SJ20_9HYPO
MAEFNIPVSDNSYILNHQFYMPTDEGSVWAIALRNTDGTLLTAGISVALTVIFMRLWRIICFIALSHPGRRTRRRYAALVTLWNSNDPLVAFRELASYSLHYFGSSWGDFAYGLTFCISAFVIFGGSLALGIAGPSLVQIGHVAPVQPNRLYYPEYAGPKDVVGTLQRYSLLATETLRALGSVDIAKATMRKRVVVQVMDMNNNGNNTVLHIGYSYNLTGVDFGLQHGTDLALQSRGLCITEYGWIVDDQDDTKDVYHLWGLEDQKVVVPIDEQSAQESPRAFYGIHPDAVNQVKKDGNVSFAIGISSAHRVSYSAGSDPWYQTEIRNQTTNDQAIHQTAFRIQRARPVLSCWQQDQWSYGAHKVNSVMELGKIPDMKIKPVLLYLLQDILAYPVLYTFGVSCGNSALKSGRLNAMSLDESTVDAQASHVFDDIERLVIASFVKSRNVFVDTTMFETPGQLKNIMETGPPLDAGEFVVSSQNVQTFSMVGLIALVTVLVALVLIELTLTLLLRTRRYNEPPANLSPEEYKRSSIRSSLSNEGTRPQQTRTGTTILFQALSASQLFRRIYELEDDKSLKDWKCSRQFPEPNDETKFALVDECTREGCKGHIQRPTRS